jgi:hypothetical protein
MTFDPLTQNVPLLTHHHILSLRILSIRFFNIFLFCTILFKILRMRPFMTVFLFVLVRSAIIRFHLA